MKIAIVKLSALGDIVHAMVALQFIKQRYPDAKIDWIVEANFAGVLEGNPDINQILTVNLKALKQDKMQLWAEIKRVKAYAHTQYELVIDAQGLIKSAMTARLISPHTIGFSKSSIREKLATWFYKKVIQIPYDANTIDRNVAVIGRGLDITISSQQIIDKQAFLFYQTDHSLNHYFTQKKPTIIVVIGSTWESRNYPKEHYLQVIKDLKVNSLLIWGNVEEKQRAEWIATQTEYATVLPRLNFNRLKYVLAQADCVIGNDTGPTHMAWGLNTASITLFGPTPISRVYQTPINRVLKSPSIVNPFKLNKNDFSIKQIKTAEVVLLAKQLLNLT